MGRDVCSPRTWDVLFLSLPHVCVGCMSLPCPWVPIGEMKMALGASDGSWGQLDTLSLYVLHHCTWSVILGLFAGFRVVTN